MKRLFVLLGVIVVLASFPVIFVFGGSIPVALPISTEVSAALVGSSLVAFLLLTICTGIETVCRYTRTVHRVSTAAYLASGPVATAILLFPTSAAGEFAQGFERLLGLTLFLASASLYYFGHGGHEGDRKSNSVVAPFSNL